MFGSSQPTGNENEVFFKLDSNLVDVCKGMGTHLVNGIALHAHEVHTIDVPEHLFTAFRANLALQMLRKWGMYYVQLGMAMARSEELRVGKVWVRPCRSRGERDP